MTTIQVQPVTIDCLRQPPPFWLDQPLVEVPLDDIVVRNLHHNVHTGIVAELCVYPSLLPIWLCEFEPGRHEIMNGRHRVLAAVETGRDSILAHVHAHVPTPMIINARPGYDRDER